MNKLVVITSRFPFPLDKGDKLRAYHQIKNLSINKDVYLICLTDEDIDDEHIREVKKYCKEIDLFKLSKIQIIFNLIRVSFTKKPFQVGYFYNKQLHKKIKERIKEIKPSNIYCQLVRCAEYVKHEHTISKTIDYMDTLSKGMQRRIPSAPYYMRILLKIEAKRLKIYESTLFFYFDRHTIISLQDQELIHLEERETIKVIPNGIDINYFTPIKTNKKYSILFNGNMQYEPNVVSAIYLANQVLPIIHKTNPEVTLLISGTSPTKEVLSLQTDKIHVSGWVADIRDSYNSASVFVAPMQIGTGLQNKLLEAMAMKMPCVTSKLANNALKANPDEEILIGENAKDYARKIIKLLINEEFKHKIAMNGFNYVAANFDWVKSTEELNRFID